jgi:hypothetical protein
LLHSCAWILLVFIEALKVFRSRNGSFQCSNEKGNSLK